MTDHFRERLAAALAATYRIDDELLGGGMSRVFAATEHALGRKVVIKVLPPELSAGVNRERFQREIQVAAQLQHPHVVPLLSAGRVSATASPDDATAPGRSPELSSEGDLLYYTMPFIEGESLRATIARRGRLPVREVVRILHDVVEALAYAHGRGVVHRDIKPGNILTIGSHALVTDFGVAKALSAAMPVSGMTSAGMAIGTPAYMAPEQLAADPAADHRIDIYAVGLLAYELLSGQSPFVGTSPQATMAAQLTRVPDPLDTVRDDVPPALAQIIMRCLEKLPENRPQSANALLDELDGVSTPAAGTGASTAVTAKLSAAPNPSPWAQRKAVIAGVMLVLIVGVAVALGTWRRVSGTGGAEIVGSGSGAGAGTAATAGTSGTPSADSTGLAAAAAAIPPRAINDTAVRTPVVLSAAESLAIADAVRKRVTARRDSQVAKGERALADSLTKRFERALSDSLARIMAELRGGRRVEVAGVDPKDLERFRELAKMATALQPNVAPNAAKGRTPVSPSGPVVVVPPGLPPGTTVHRVQPPAEAPLPVPLPAPGVKRVLLGTPRMTGGRRDLFAISSAVTDSLRRGIGGTPGFDVVDASQLTDPRYGAMRTRTSLARAVGAGAVMSGIYYPRGDSTIVLQLQLFDVSKNRIARVVESKPMSLREPLGALPDLIASTVAALEAIDWKSTVLPDTSR